MAINWNKHKFKIEELSEKNLTNDLIIKLCENYALDISALLEHIDKSTNDYSYFTNLKKALNKIQKKYETKQIKGK